ATNRTIDRTRTNFGAVAFAFVANIEFSDFDFFFGAESRFFERDLHVVTQIRAALSVFAMPCDATKKGFENVPTDSTATKNLPKDIERIVESPTKSPALFEGGVTEAVVGSAFVTVHQHIVSLAELLELFFGVRIVRIFVRMKFHRELAIRALDLLGR